MVKGAGFQCVVSLIYRKEKSGASNLILYLYVGYLYIKAGYINI